MFSFAFSGHFLEGPAKPQPRARQSRVTVGRKGLMEVNQDETVLIPNQLTQFPVLMPRPLLFPLPVGQSHP